MILPNMISEPQIPVVHDSFTFSSRFFFFGDSLANLSLERRTKLLVSLVARAIETQIFVGCIWWIWLVVGKRGLAVGKVVATQICFIF